VDQTLYAKHLEIAHHVLAFLISLVLHPDVVQNVSVMVNAQVTWRVSISDVKIHALDHVQPMQNAM
jgi:hypothetical protein